MKHQHRSEPPDQFLLCLILLSFFPMTLLTRNLPTHKSLTQILHVGNPEKTLTPVKICFDHSFYPFNHTIGLIPSFGYDLIITSVHFLSDYLTLKCTEFFHIFCRLILSIYSSCLCLIFQQNSILVLQKSATWIFKSVAAWIFHVYPSHVFSTKNQRNLKQRNNEI